jgi:hypothetical protein
MNGKTYTKSKLNLILIIIVFGFMVGFGSQFYSEKDNAGRRLFLKNKAGDIVFEHQNHAEMEEECANCHHDLLLYDQFTFCNECHDDDYKFEYYEHDALVEVEEHSCTTCHEINDDKNPKNCRDCHPMQKESEETLVSCEFCHDDEMSREDLANHAEFLAIEDHSCDGCHLPQQLSDAYHAQSNRCHLKNNEDMFANDDGKFICEKCHLK